MVLMHDDLAEALSIRNERMALECVDVPCAARRLTIGRISNDRVVIHHDGRLIGMFWVPHCPDVLFAAAGFNAGEVEIVYQEILRTERRREELRVRLDETIVRLRHLAETPSEVRAFLAGVDAEARTANEARRAARLGELKRRERIRRMGSLSLRLRLGIGVALGAGVLLLAELLERCY
jgi:hypothetical protein